LIAVELIRHFGGLNQARPSPIIQPAAVKFDSHRQRCRTKPRYSPGKAKLFKVARRDFRVSTMSGMGNEINAADAGSRCEPHGWQTGVSAVVRQCISTRTRWAVRVRTWLTGILLLAGLSLPWLNPFVDGPSPAVMSWLVTLACLAPVLLVLACRRVNLAATAAQAWLLAALLSSVIGLLQYAGFSAAWSPWINNTNPGEAFANLRQRNQFATLTNIGLVALLWWVAQTRPPLVAVAASRSIRPGWRSALPLAAAVLLGVGNAASSSRTGLVQLALLLALAWAWGGWGRPDMRRVLLAAVLAYGGAALMLPVLAGLDPHTNGILARLRAGDSACSSRLTLWRNVLHLIGLRPWFGWGWGELDYAHFITLYPGPRFCDILDNAHNLPLHLAVELGVPAALLVCGGGLWLAWRERPWRERDASRQMAWGVLAVILLHSLLEYPLWYGPFQLASGLCLLVLWTTRPPHTGRKQTPGMVLKARKNRLLGSVITVAIALFSMAYVLYAAWDYHRVGQIYRDPALRSAPYRDNTLEKVADSWLFQNQVRFAELTITPLTVNNAAHVRKLATGLLHFSPEPRVVELLLESAVLLGRDDEVRFYLLRYRAAFPKDHARWAAPLSPQ
jgi:O-antigen ligase